MVARSFALVRRAFRMRVRQRIFEQATGPRSAAHLARSGHAKDQILATFRVWPKLWLGALESDHFAVADWLAAGPLWPCRPIAMLSSESAELS